jgi:hypothetical protein
MEWMPRIGGAILAIWKASSSELTLDAGRESMGRLGETGCFYSNVEEAHVEILFLEGSR